MHMMPALPFPLQDLLLRRECARTMQPPRGNGLSCAASGWPWPRLVLRRNCPAASAAAPCPTTPRRRATGSAAVWPQPSSTRRSRHACHCRHDVCPRIGGCTTCRSKKGGPPTHPCTCKQHGQTVVPWQIPKPGLQTHHNYYNTPKLVMWGSPVE